MPTLGTLSLRRTDFMSCHVHVMLYLDNKYMSSMIRLNSLIVFLDLCKNALGNKGITTLYQALNVSTCMILDTIM